MMTALTKATFLVGLPLGAAWYFRHGYVLIAVALVVVAFAFIIGTNFRRDVRERRDEENLHEHAKSDGRNVAELMKVRSEPQGPTSAELPGKSVAHLEDL